MTDQQSPEIAIEIDPEIVANDVKALDPDDPEVIIAKALCPGRLPWERVTATGTILRLVKGAE